MLILYVIPVVGGCMNPSTPFDYLINVGCAPADPSLRANDDRTLVVLQHGIWRSAGALHKLERSLRAHGYLVLNPSYPSTRASIEAHAERLAAEVSSTLDRIGEPRPRVYFVGHSMGGMVIASYLRRDDATPAAGCVFLGTPHRGATLADQRADWLLYKILMGTHAGQQLRTTVPLHDQPFENLGVVGTIVGGRGDDDGYHGAIPGDDDGRVGVTEAHHEDEVDSIFFRLGHTRMTIAEGPLLAVLHFLKHHRFPHAAPRQR